MNLSPLTILLLIWGVVALCLIIMVIYRGVISLNEETELIVDKAESHFADEQRELSARLDRLAKPIKILSVLTAVLLLVIAGLWIYQGIIATR